jgi:hypothetical protein
LKKASRFAGLFFILFGLKSANFESITLNFFAMDIQVEKLKLIRWLTNITDENVIAELVALRHKKQDWWDEISAEEKAEIEEGLGQADRGETTPHEEIRKKYEKWL